MAARGPLDSGTGDQSAVLLAGDGCACFSSHLGVRIVLGHLREPLEHCARHVAIPRWFAGDAAESVGGVSPDPRDWVVECICQRDDGTFVRNVVEQLDAPPADLGVGIGEPFAKCCEGGVAQSCGAQLGSCDSANEGPHGLGAFGLDSESLDQLTLHDVRLGASISASRRFSGWPALTVVESGSDDAVRVAGRVVDAEAEQVDQSAGVAAGGYGIVRDWLRGERSDAAARAAVAARRSGPLDQVPPIAGDVEEHGEPAVGLVARWSDELDTGSGHPGVRGVEVVDAEEEPDPAGDLAADSGRLVVTVGAGEQDAGRRARRPADDPALWTSVVGQRRRVAHQLEPEGADEELDGGVVVLHDDRDEVDPHRTQRTGASQRTDRARDRGSITAFVAVIAFALVMVAGMAYDGGQVLVAHQAARNDAERAARAGAQQIDLTHLRQTNQPRLDPAGAEAAAQGYLAQTGSSGTVAVDGATITVTVTRVQPLLILPSADRVITVSETATAMDGTTP